MLYFFQVLLLLLILSWSSSSAYLVDQDPSHQESTLIFIVNQIQNQTDLQNRNDYIFNHDDLAYSDKENNARPRYYPVYPPPRSYYSQPVNPTHFNLGGHPVNSNPVKYNPTRKPPVLSNPIQYNPDRYAQSQERVYTPHRDRVSRYDTSLSPTRDEAENYEFPFDNFWQANYEDRMRKNGFFNNFLPPAQPKPKLAQTTTSTTTTIQTAKTPVYSTTTSNVRNYTTTHINYEDDKIYYPTVRTTTTTTRPPVFSTTTASNYVTNTPNPADHIYPNLGPINPFLQSNNLRKDPILKKVDPKNNESRPGDEDDLPVCPFKCECSCEP